MYKNFKQLSKYISWIHKRKIILSFFVSDFLCLSISLLVTNLIFKDTIVNISEICLLTIIWGSFSYIFGRYSNPKITKKYKSIAGQNFSIFFNVLSFFIIYYFVIRIVYFENYFSLIIGGKFIFSSIALIFNSLSLKLLKRSEINKKKVNRFWAFYGSKEKFTFFSEIIKKNHSEENYHFKYLQKNESLPSKYKGVIFSPEDNSKEFDGIINNNFFEKNINIYFLNEWLEMHLNRIPIELLSLTNFFKNFNRLKNNKIQFRLKRYGDIALSISLLIVTFPILIISGFFIWITDRGPVIYKQKRVGKNGREFFIFKLRTMIIDAEEDGPKWVAKKDSRITFIGRILRKTRIDELPQLICVLNGDMSLIGPRPERPEIEIKLKSEIKNYDLRYLTKPGLSGWAQVNSNYAASTESVKLKHSYDLYYISNQSLLIDFLILFKTIKVVFTGKGSEPI